MSDSLDLDAVNAWIADATPALGRVTEARRFPGGASNLTFLLRTDAHDLVLRRPPPGTKAKGAHDMVREFRFLERLHPVFPYCPEPLAVCEDADVLGEPFFLMERLDGQVIGRDLPEGMTLDPGAARRLCENLVDVHVELHAVDFEAAGLGDLGRPEGYVGRQVGGWCKRYRNARTEDVPDNEPLMAWLESNQPAESGAAIVHNDFKLDNVVLQPREGDYAITGVLDWEMVTLGDPLMDLGASLAYWIQADDPAPLLGARLMPTHLPGMMTRRELIDRYLDGSGRRCDDVEFYYVFGLFRLAVIVQQIYYRYHHGQNRDARFAGLGQLGALLSARAAAILAGEARL